MACDTALYVAIIFSIFFIIPIIESSKCSNKYTFQEWQLNSSIPSDLNLSSNDSNDTINQNCLVNLSIDFTTGLVNGSFTVENLPYGLQNQLHIVTKLSLSSTSKKVHIIYRCSISDYCDIDFVRETLSPALASLQVESIRQKLAARLYNSSSTDPVNCSNNHLCPQNTSFCSPTYSHNNGTSGGNEEVESKCTDLVDREPIFVWLQTYTPFIRDSRSDIVVYHCNIPNCGSNNTVIETFRWLAHEYIFPLNISVLNVTTTTVQTTTTTSNYASNLFGQLNTIILCFAIILHLH